MPKNIVIRCDGTGDEFGDRNSNVVKLYQTLTTSAAQITYYHPGLGTMGARSALTSIGKWWTRMIGLAFGYGISDNLADAYQFLMGEFQPGDHLFIFGFSRGAYTARALCGMLHVMGLLTKGNDALIPYAVRMIKRKAIDFPVAAQFKSTFARECKPHFVGVWDTVSSVGWVYNAVRFPFTTAKSNPDLQIVRHAVAIDERRAFFRQNMFGAPHDPQQDVKEVWFAGAHSDVGGGYPETESQLSQIALRWLLCESEIAGLIVDPQQKAAILEAKEPTVGHPAADKLHESLHGWWWVGEVVPKVVHVQTAPGEWRESIRVNLGRRRFIPSDALIHESVKQRLERPGLDYLPTNLPPQCVVVSDRCRK